MKLSLCSSRICCLCRCGHRITWPLWKYLLCCMVFLHILSLWLSEAHKAPQVRESLGSPTERATSKSKQTISFQKLEVQKKEGSNRDLPVLDHCQSFREHTACKICQASQALCSSYIGKSTKYHWVEDSKNTLLVLTINLSVHFWSFHILGESWYISNARKQILLSPITYKSDSSQAWPGKGKTAPYIRYYIAIRHLLGAPTLSSSAKWGLGEACFFYFSVVCFLFVL